MAKGWWGNMEMKTKVIIVSDNARQENANFLAQLISRKDDDENNVLGVKDGSIETSVWTEKQYEDNKVQLPSSAKVIFIGQSQKIKKETSQIPNKFYKYGMIYGWLGSKAVLKITDWIHAGLYTPVQVKEFMDFSEEYQKKLNIQSEPNEMKVLNFADDFFGKVKDTVFIGTLQYKCLVNVFYVDGLSEFIGDQNGEG